MAVITLTTDWSKNDFYTGTVKGMLLSRCPGITIVDISHQVQPFNTAQAAFLLRNTYPHFPTGTIHLIGIETVAVPDPVYLAIRADGHYFLGADNGSFGLIFQQDPEKIVTLPLPEDMRQMNFPMTGVLVPAAVRLINGEKLETIGKEISDFDKRTPMRATIEESVITGSVIYIDSFNNAITNITEELFHRVRKSRKFDIFIQSNHYKVNVISPTYSDRPVGELVVIFNSLGLMEIAINHGKAAELLNLAAGSAVRVKFKE
jgi:S-adenosylmethionine hydrolase